MASEENSDEIFEEELDLVCASIDYCGFKREDLDKRVTWPADGATRESWPWERASGTVETKLNRKAAMEALDSGEFWNLLEIEIKAIDKNPGMRRERGRDEPVLEGSAADKFENAKGPLLAAGDNRSHVVQHLIAHKVERALQSDPRFGHPRNEGDAYKHLSEFFTLFVEAGLSGKKVFAGSLDWSDFNAHLRPKHMEMALRAIGRRIMRDTLEAEDRESLQKLIDRECRVILNHHLTVKDFRFPAEQGEFSGIRLTDTFNSLCNYVMYPFHTFACKPQRDSCLMWDAYDNLFAF